MMERKTKTAFVLDNPYSNPQWPHLSPDISETILDLLCSLIEPIGHYRNEYINRSKGKRSKKRKRDNGSGNEDISKPSQPSLSSYLTIGFNSTIRQLETIIQNRPSNFNEDLGEPSRSPFLAAVIVPLPPTHSINPLYSSIPQFIYSASSSTPIRLIPLPKAAESRLCSCLELPRVGFLGIFEDAPGAGPLISYIRNRIAEVEVLWLKNAIGGRYKEVNIRATEIPVGVQPKNTKATKPKIVEVRGSKTVGALSSARVS
ncbi:MAG: hypothetical protein M1834_000685 [Cirrosporium novae-zelandiae]|nr:MAG: hypothetical protein M1834_000685 [Cirrosporium novae-zelandiae]